MASPSKLWSSTSPSLPPMPDIKARLVRGWHLLTESFPAVARYPRLMVFPVFTLGCTVVIILFFLVPVVLFPTGHALSSSEHWKAALHRLDDRGRPWYLRDATHAWVAGLYFATMFCATFSNVALYSQIMVALAGEPVSLRAGLRFALKRIRAILFWSLFAGVVGWILRLIEDRLPWIGRLVMGLIGTVWSVASVFVIPVIVREENANPLTLLRRSASTIRKTWGEALIGYVGFAGLAIASSVFVLGCLAVAFALGGFAWVVQSGPLIPLLICFGALLLLIAFFCVLYVAENIFKCSLYIYATEGVIPEPYTAEIMDAAWKVKKRTG
jgi:hypothetical protein